MKNSLFENQINKDLVKRLENKIYNLQQVIEVKDIVMKRLLKENEKLRLLEKTK